MQSRTVIWIVVGILVVAGLCVLLACVGFFLWNSARPVTPGGPIRPSAREFQSNGARIYFTSTSQRGTPITFDMMGGRGGMRMSEQWSCADCHGPEGQGGTVRMMMQIVDAPDIRWDALTSSEHGEEHGAFTEADVRRAIVEGVEPDGEALEWPMPRWNMTEADLDDLIAFMKTLD